MPSLKSHLVAFVIRRTRKKAFASVEAINRWIARARLTEDHRPPATVKARLTIEERDVAGFPVYDVHPATPRSTQRLVYLHGGAYVFEITSHHWYLIAELAERLGCTVTVPIYPIAPEYTFRTMFGMVLDVYRDLLATIAPEDIAFIGDSAGANMALVITMLAAEQGVPAPARHVLISPGVDMTLANEEVKRLAPADPWLDIPGGLEAIRHYSEGIAVSDWRISPLYGDLSVLPKTLLLTGTRDLLTPDNLIFAERAKAAGVQLDLVLEPGMFHVWPLIDMPEARRARDRIVAFLQREEELEGNDVPALQLARRTG